MEWNDITDVWLYWDDMKSRIIRNVGERIGFSSGMITITVLLKLLKTVQFISPMLLDTTFFAHC